MKNLLKLSTVALSLFAFAQAQALTCPAGQYAYYTGPKSKGVCVNSSIPGAYVSKGSIWQGGGVGPECINGVCP